MYLVIMPKAVPNHDPAGQNVEAAIQEVLELSRAAGIHGKDVTPFILRAVAEKTGGDSLRRYVLFCLLEFDRHSFPHSSWSVATYPL
jgi:pseudouridine-5'-phosphate glycosidase